jgi:hypothetical protein
MDLIRAICPDCSNWIQFQGDAESVVCGQCGGPFRVREHQGSVSLSRIRSGAEWSAEDDLRLVDERLADIDEMLTEAEAESEALRSREKAGPLSLGCSFFSLFLGVLMVLILFMLIGKKYMDTWLFYFALAVVVALGVARIRARMPEKSDLDALREKRQQVEEIAATLARDRARLESLKSRLISSLKP